MYTVYRAWSLTSPDKDLPRLVEISRELSGELAGKMSPICFFLCVRSFTSSPVTEIWHDFQGQK